MKSKSKPSLLLLVSSMMLVTLYKDSKADPITKTQQISNSLSSGSSSGSEDPLYRNTKTSLGGKRVKKYRPSLSNYYSYYPGGRNSGGSESYYEDYYERPGRKLSARSSTFTMAPMASSQVGFLEDSDYSATGHGDHGGGGHGHGHDHGHQGWGWGGWGQSSHHTYHHDNVSKVDNSSLALLGLLGLLSLLSNVLLLLTTTAAPAPARRRRPIPGKKVVVKRSALDMTTDDNELDPVSHVEWICLSILPSLNIIGHIHDGHLPANCTSQEICRTNKVLTEELGIQGRAVGSMLSTRIVDMLRQSKLAAEKNETALLRAALDGRNQASCETKYPLCDALKNSTSASSRFPDLISADDVVAIVRGRRVPSAAGRPTR